MAKHPDYPGVSSYQDRHGKTRWRFRKTGLKPALLPGEPGSKPFASPGDTVAAGQTLLIVEAMKVMNSIAAPRAGTVKSVLVENGQPVEYDQPLVIVE